MCLYPKLIRNRKYVPNKKNNGEPPTATDIRVKMVPVGCGKCMECKKQKARQWNIRLQEEVRTNTHGEYITLTFSNEKLKEVKEQLEGNPEGYNLDNAIATKATRLFLERWRKKYKVSIKHWLITELGHNGTENIHLHGIVWKNDKFKKVKKGTNNKYCNYLQHFEKYRAQLLEKQKQDIEKIWGYGYVYIGEWVNEQTVNYITKYVTKQDGLHKEYNAKILTSAGIGDNYTNRIDARKNKFNNTGETKETYTTRQGQEINLPIYYRNKIYTDEEKEKLWLQKLDKEERWVDGSKVSTKNGLTEYNNLLKQARKKNAQLGYGNDEKDWNQIAYENQLREIKIRKRLENEK